MLRASGAFEEYSRWDAANDTLLRADPILSKGNSVGRAMACAAGVASGFGLSVVSMPACITGIGAAGIGGCGWCCLIPRWRIVYARLLRAL